MLKMHQRAFGGRALPEPAYNTPHTPQLDLGERGPGLER